MSTELGRQLREIAAEAPPTLSAGDLWERGVRRQRARRAAAVLVAVVVLAASGGLGLHVADGLRGATPGPASPTRTGHLPDAILAPAPWSKGTSESGEVGPLAVLGSSDRKRTQGLFGMVAYEGMYGVSAIDGTARFLDIPTSTDPDRPGELSLSASLSPDGRKVAYPRYDPKADTMAGYGLLGWNVYDTVTGQVVEMSDPEVPRMEFDGDQAIFTADSRHVLTSYRPEGVNDSRQNRLAVWDVTTGSPTPLEAPGMEQGANIGSGPGGAVWSRGRTTYTFDPATGTRSQVRTDHDVVSASFATQGTGFAYIGGTLTSDGINAPWQLYVGPSQNDLRQVRGLDDVNSFLGWRDENHVVVVTSLQDYAIVDVRDGSVERASFGGSINLNVPVIASDLWANGLEPGVRPPDVGDPRTDERLAVLVVVALGVGFLVVRRRRRG